jgi:two-component system, LytTR family, sensor kinase
MKKFWELFKPLTSWQFVASNMLLAFVILLLFMSRAFSSTGNFMVFYAWAILICITQWTSLTYVHHLIDQRIRWIEKPITRSLLGIVTLVLDSVVVFAIVQFGMMYLVYRLRPTDAWPYIAQSFIYSVLISFIMSLLFTAIGFFKAWKKELVNAEKLKVEMLAYRYESLRNQINPHFLFNSFNVLNDLVYADQAMAVKFINQLSDLFRYVLDSRDKELVSLKEELDFMNSYIYLLKTRFEDKLELRIDMEAAPDELIVPMTLQLLVENAVKHNEVSDAFPLRIHIRRDNSYLEVENSLQRKKVGEESKNTGLKNIIQQFSYFTDREVEVRNSDGKFMVRVPVLKSSEK